MEHQDDKSKQESLKSQWKIEEDYLNNLEAIFKTGSHLKRNAPPEQSIEPQSAVLENTQQDFPDANKLSEEKQKEEILLKNNNTSEPEKISSNAIEYEPGTIIKLEDGSIAIYKQKVTGKEYNLVYILDPQTGKATPRGIFISGYNVEKIGKLSDEVLENIRKSLTWNRDAIIFSLDKFEFCSLIPEIKSSIKEPIDKKSPIPTPKPVEKKVKSLFQKGRRITISFGDKEWDAYYWGADELGAIFVYFANGHWTAMHLNLRRFGDSIRYGEILSTNKIKEIDFSIIGK